MISLRDAQQVQTDETLGWKLSSVDDADPADGKATSEIEDLKTLIDSFDRQSKTWIGKVTSAVHRMISQFKLPLCAKRVIVDQLSQSLSSASEAPSVESFERILSESLRAVQYDEEKIQKTVKLGKRQRRERFTLQAKEDHYMSFSEGEDTAPQKRQKQC